MEKTIEIPFGAKDSELKGWEYTIPECMEARIENGKIIVRKKESKDEKIIGRIKKAIESYWSDEPLDEILAWLEKQGEQNLANSEKNCKVEPKFKIGDIIKPKDGGHEPWQIMQVDILDEKYRFKDGYVIHFSQEDQYELVEQNPADKDELFDHRYAQHLVESQRQKSMIQWKGDNLKEVIDFTGKDKNFDKWFKSFEEYEQYVQKHNGIFKLFNADGSHYEVPVGAWIVKTPDGCNVASKAIFKQNPAWSEEDEKMLNDVIGAIENLISRNESWGYLEDSLDWLKSLKERYTLKPSDEQMEYLSAAIEESNENPVLESLYNELKKLKG